MAKGNFAKESFSGLPSWAKGVVAIAVVGGIGYLLYKTFSKVGDIKDDKGLREEKAGWEQEFDKLNSNPSTKATLSKSQLSSFANKIFTAMDGYQTDEDAVINTFYNLKNDADFAGLQAAWGIREISSGRFNPEPNFKGNLISAIASEMNTSERSKINTILMKKGIKYRV